MTSFAECNIDGMKVVPLEIFSDPRGSVMRMMRKTDAHFLEFGEIYFSTVKPGVVKAWKNHKTVTANYACVHGRIRFVMFDARPDSPTFENLYEVEIGPDHYGLLVVPPGVWNGFQGAADETSILASCATEVYDPEEFERVPPSSDRIPYVWAQRGDL